MIRVSQTIAALALCSAAALNAQTAGDALLVVAHGATKPGWNERVIRLLDKVEWDGPKGVAFLTPASPDQALANVAGRLDQTGAKRIVVVPLLVSSFSDHYEEIRYYARERKDAPGHVDELPLKTRAQLVLTSAMDSSPLLGRILAEEVRSASLDPKKESVILVAHGPNDDEDNLKWIACLKVQAVYLQQTAGFLRVEVATMRDDAPKEIKDAAIAQLKERVKANAADTTVLIQPVLISVGHVQAEIVQHLAGLEFKMSPSGVSEHPLAAEWIRRQAAAITRPAGN